MNLLLSFLMLLTLANAQDKLTTSKTSCIQQSVYPNKTLAQQKKILIEQAKQESLEELYGTLIVSKTDIENGKLTNDSIKSRAVGAVRVDGNPSFYNGKNLGEICADVSVYITKEDLEKYKPKKVSLTKYCFNDPSVAMKDIKQQAKYGAYKEMLSQYKASLKVTGKQAEQFIHEFTISNDKFDFDTASYCFNAVGTILPYELEIGPNVQKSKQEKIKKRSKYFLIKNKATGKCIDVSGYQNMTNGANIQSQNCGRVNYPLTDQLWEITSEGFIKNKATGKCIDVSGYQDTNNGANIQSWDCEKANDPRTDQLWKITSEGFIKNKVTGKCIDVSGYQDTKDGANIQSWDCEKANDPRTDQLWEFI